MTKYANEHSDRLKSIINSSYLHGYFIADDSLQKFIIIDIPTNLSLALIHSRAVPRIVDALKQLGKIREGNVSNEVAFAKPDHLHKESGIFKIRSQVLVISFNFV